jgi:hypothetical protein
LAFLARISTRHIGVAAALVLYASFTFHQIEAVTLIFAAAAVVAALLIVIPTRTTVVRLVVTMLAYGIFITARFEIRRIVIATLVAVWVIVTTYYAERARTLGRAAVASAFGMISDLWLIAMLTLLTLEGYLVTGLLLISAASWLPRAGKAKPWLTIAFALLGGWLIIAAKVDINLELRRWYLLGAFALGIAASLLISAQEVQQRKDVDPQ